MICTVMEAAKSNPIPASFFSYDMQAPCAATQLQATVIFSCRNLAFRFNRTSFYKTRVVTEHVLYIFRKAAE
jgi:hypothetical protein